MNINKFRFLLFLIVIALFSSCKSTKNITYLEGAESLSTQQLAQSKQPFSARIKPNDLLKIVVSGSEDPETYMPFNILSAVPANSNETYSQTQLQNYLVDAKGQINFPVLGKLQVTDLSAESLAKIITEKLRSYLKGDVVVTVRFANYKISVLGEVTVPGSYTVKDEKINILQALSMAGDLTIYGRRDVVKILREGPDGQKSITTLNLNDKNLIFSPCFYLQQGDVIYVEPNKAKAKGADVGSATNVVFSVVSILIGVTSLIVTMVKF
jgi:polysaccharide biosynthesis/export protein